MDLDKSRGHDEAINSAGHHDSTQLKNKLTQGFVDEDCDLNCR